MGLLCYPAYRSMVSPKQKRFIEALATYAQFHQNGAMDKHARTLVWVCNGHCAGLGDRIKGITYSLLLAMFSQRRLFITWESYDYTFLRHNNLFLTTHMHGEPVSLFSVLRKPGISMSPDAAFKILMSIGENQTNIFLTTNMEPSRLLTDTWSSKTKWIPNGLQKTGLGDFSSEELDELQGQVFSYLFTLDHKLLDEVQHARSVIGLEDTRYVGVHVRTGFVGTEVQEVNYHPKLIRNQDNWEKILKCAVNTADRLLGNDSLIFLACDSNMVKDLAHRRYGHRIRTLNNTLMHVDELPEHERPEDKRQAIISMWIDLLLLAESYAIVRTDSGFAILAGQLCSLADNRTVDGLHCSY